jgi:hypothetical protein
VSIIAGATIDSHGLGECLAYATVRQSDSGTALWVIRKSDLQRPRMLADIRRLLERRKAHASWLGYFRSVDAVKGDRREPRSRRAP